MNPAAAAAHALVLYPAQPRSANPNACWNWYDPENQQRGIGEPALLIDMLRDVASRHPVDVQRVYVAGMSAGGAMAAVLGREYPDVFAAVGVHSGLQAGAAHNVMAALSAMSTGAKPGPYAKAPTHPAAAPLPLIVFHGDADSTVHSKNGEQLVEAAIQTLVGGGGAVEHDVQDGKSVAGQRFTRHIYRHTGATATENTDSSASPAVVAEHWVLHGAGHAWSGGHSPGTLTDPRGISATQEMLRFFLEHPKNHACTVQTQTP
jgi:poly(hydroxyalkanoate) depolymerase family esterase